jgi:flagellar hook-associated protein 1
MGFGLALSNTLSALRANQQALALVSQNLANANVEGYTRLEVKQVSQVVNNSVAGVDVRDSKRSVDEYINAAYVRQQTGLSYDQTIKEAYDRLELYFGQPGKENSINTQIDNFFATITDLAASPDQQYLRSAAMQQAQLLADKFSELSSNLHSARFDIDQEISRTVIGLSGKIDSLGKVNDAIRDVGLLGGDKNYLFDKRDGLVKEMRQIADVQFIYDDDGRVSVNLSRAQLLAPDAKFSVSYTPAPTLQLFKDGLPTKEIVITQLDSEGKLTDSTSILVSASDADIQENYLESGKLKALIDLRDEKFPVILDQLDNLAYTFMSTFNEIQNSGSGFPPKSKLTGTTEVTLNSEFYFSGQARIAIINKNGTPAEDPYDSDLGQIPLTLDLSRLNGGSGDGTAKVSDIINEINSYFGPPSTYRANIEPLQDIKLVAVSPTKDAGNNLQFDLEFTNLEDKDSTVKIDITGVDVDGAARAYGTFSQFTAEPGLTQRTHDGTDNNDYLDIDFTAEAAGTSHDIKVAIRVTTTDENGLVTVRDESITYSITIPAPTANIKNTRFPPTAIQGGDGELQQVQDNSRFMTARLVDADGNTLSDTAEYGFLQLESAKGIWGIAIDQLDSQEDGAVDGSTEATNRGISHFFGLNNFFVGGETLEGAALNMDIREEYKGDASSIATGQLTISSQPTDSDSLPVWTYEIGKGSSQIARRIANMQLQAVAFAAAGGLPETTLTFGNYSAEILGDYALKANTAQDNLDKSQTLADGLKARKDAVGGVNIDEELANTVVFQNSYSAAARMINVMNSLMESLLQSF